MILKPLAGDSPELKWFKSSHSTNESPSCVEVATAPGTIHIRDSKRAQGPQLAFGPQQWAAFVSYAADH
ncbi:DUF397 domain-containing protein [Streptomyces sp. NPDC004752]